MQANSIRINSWGKLFTLFTNLEPENRKMAVLRAIADPKTVISHSWDNCLFAVAARAAKRSIRRPIFTNEKRATQALGISTKWIRGGIEVWDGRQDNEQPREVMKRVFRNRIRKHLADLEKAQRALETAMEQARRANRFVEGVKQTLANHLTASPHSMKETKARELTHV